jgi:hypothetical protein
LRLRLGPLSHSRGDALIIKRDTQATERRTAAE